MRLAPQAPGLLCALVRLEPFKTMDINSNLILTNTNTNPNLISSNINPTLIATNTNSLS